MPAKPNARSGSRIGRLELQSQNRREDRRCNALWLAWPRRAVRLFGGVARAQVSDDVVKIGVLTDLSGPAATATGPGSVAAAQMAVDDFGGKVLGKPIR